MKRVYTIVPFDDQKLFYSTDIIEFDFFDIHKSDDERKKLINEADVVYFCGEEFHPSVRKDMKHCVDVNKPLYINLIQMIIDLGNDDEKVRGLLVQKIKKELRNKE